MYLFETRGFKQLELSLHICSNISICMETIENQNVRNQTEIYSMTWKHTMSHKFQISAVGEAIENNCFLECKRRATRGRHIAWYCETLGRVKLFIEWVKDFKQKSFILLYDNATRLMVTLTKVWLQRYSWKFL